MFYSKLLDYINQTYFQSIDMNNFYRKSLSHFADNIVIINCPN